MNASSVSKQVGIGCTCVPAKPAAKRTAVIRHPTNTQPNISMPAGIPWSALPSRGKVGCGVTRRMFFTRIESVDYLQISQIRFVIDIERFTVISEPPTPEGEYIFGQ